MFDEGELFARRSTAASFLRSKARRLVREIARDTEVPPYSVRQVLDEMILRVRELGLQLNPGRRPPTLIVIRRFIERTLRRLARGRQLLFR
jgi:hypothetical protein